MDSMDYFEDLDEISSEASIRKGRMIGRSRRSNLVEYGKSLSAGTIFVALLYVALSLTSLSLFKKGLQIVLAYSRCGRTIDL